MDNLKKKSLRRHRRLILDRLTVDLLIPEFHEDADGFLTTEEEMDIRSHHTSHEKALILLDYLLRKDNKAFDKFCQILQRSNLNDLADVLIREAENPPSPSPSSSSDDSASLADSEDGHCGSHEMMLQYGKIKKRFHEVCSTKGEPTLAEIKSACYDIIQMGFRRHSPLSDRIDDAHTPLETVLRIIFFEISKWISYDFLQCIVDFFGSPLKEIKDALREYSRQLCPVLKAKLKDVKLLRSQHENECQTPDGLIRVAARYHLNSDGIPVSMLIEARDFLADKLKIPKKLLVPITYEEGSITIVFWTLAELEESILEEVTRSEKDLKDVGIDCITVGRSITLLPRRTVWENQAEQLGVTDIGDDIDETSLPGTASDSGVGTATGVGTTTYISSDTQTSTLSDIETLLGSDTSDEDSEGSEIETVISTVTDVTGKPRTRGGAYKSPEKQPEATQEESTEEVREVPYGEVGDTTTKLPHSGRAPDSVFHLGVCMEENMAKALLHHLPVLEKSLQASQVVIDLRNQESGSFLSETEEKEIESKESDQKKAKKLLDILLTKESIAFYQFIEVIRRNPEKWCRKMVDDILYQAIFGESPDNPKTNRLYADAASLTRKACRVYHHDKFRCMSDPRARLDVGKLTDEIMKKSKVFEGSLFLTRELSPQDTLWKKDHHKTIVQFQPKDESKSQNEAASIGLDQLCQVQVDLLQEKHAVIIATDDEKYRAPIKKALEKGWTVELWGFDDFNIKVQSETKEEYKYNLNCFDLDVIVNKIIFIDHHFFPSHFHQELLESMLKAYAAVIRVQRYALQKNGQLEKDFREDLERITSWPIQYYSLSNPDLKTEGTRDFLLVFCPPSEEVQFELSSAVKILKGSKTQISGLEDAISIAEFKKNAPKRYWKLVNPSKYKANPPLSPPKSPSSDEAFPYGSNKDRMCRHYWLSSCTKGKKCSFAHGEEDGYCKRCQKRGHLQGSLACTYGGPDHSFPWPYPVPYPWPYPVPYPWPYPVPYPWPYPVPPIHYPKPPAPLPSPPIGSHQPPPKVPPKSLPKIPIPKEVLHIELSKEEKRPKEGDVLDAAPTAKELRNYICPVIGKEVKKWKNVCQKLGLDNATIDKASKAQSEQSYKALEVWLSKRRSTTWATLLRALCDSGFDFLAMETEKKLRNGEQLGE